MEKSTYFHSSLYRFAPSARQQIIHRLLQEHPSADCGYDAQDECFYLICPKQTGPDADDLLRKIIIEYITAASDQESPGLQQFQESRVHALFQRETADATQIPEVTMAPPHITKLYLINSEDSKVPIGALRLHELPLQVKRRYLVYLRPKAWSVLRAVSNDLEYNGREGTPIYQQEDHALMLLAPLKPLNLFVERLSDTGNKVQAGIQELKAGSGKISVKKWLDDQDDHDDDDPNSQGPRVIDKDTLKMLTAPTTAPVPGRMRVPLGASLTQLPGDDASSESSRSGDSDTASSFASKRSFGRLFATKGNEQASNKRQLQPTARVPQTAISTGSPRSKGNATQAEQHRGVVNAPQSALVSASVPATDEDISTSSSVAKQDTFPEYGKRYAIVDTIGLSGHAANQAKWELETISAGDSTPTGPSTPGFSQSGHDCEQRLAQPAWASKVVPTVSEGLLVDTSLPENLVPVRSTRNFPPLQAQSRLQTQSRLQAPSSSMPMKKKTQPEERLIDIDDDCPPIVDKLSTTTSSWPRTHNVMRQKAAKKVNKKVTTGRSNKVELPLPSPPPKPKSKQAKQATNEGPFKRQETAIDASIPPLNTRDATLRDSISYALQSTERLPTKCSIHFGNSLLPSHEVPSQIWTEKQLHKHLHSNVISSQFSRRLTTSTKDAEYILDLKSDANLKVSVIYEFHLITADRQLKILRINQDFPKQCTMVEVSPPVAEIFSFNVLRMFDMLLVLEENQTALPIMPALQRFVDTITTDVRACRLHASSPPDGLAVTRIIVKRVFDKAGLRVAQFQDLLLERSGTGIEGTRLDESDMTAAGRLWWEACIEEVDLDDPEKLMQACFKLRLRADEMVKSMDGVGFHNEGPMKDMLESPSKERAPEVYVPFW